jgi:hypothetical protein
MRKKLLEKNICLLTLSKQSRPTTQRFCELSKDAPDASMKDQLSRREAQTNT